MRQDSATTTLNLPGIAYSQTIANSEELQVDRDTRYGALSNGSVLRQEIAARGTNRLV